MCIVWQGAIRISTQSPLRLEHDRESQKVVCFEVANAVTGNLIAFGSIRMEAVHQELLERSLSNEGNAGDAFMVVNLDSAAGGKQWGRLRCRLDASALQPFVRHGDASTLPGNIVLHHNAICRVAARPFDDHDVKTKEGRASLYRPEQTEAVPRFIRGIRYHHHNAIDCSIVLCVCLHD